MSDEATTAVIIMVTVLVARYTNRLLDRYEPALGESVLRATRGLWKVFRPRSLLDGTVMVAMAAALVVLSTLVIIQQNFAAIAWGAAGAMSGWVSANYGRNNRDLAMGVNIAVLALGHALYGLLTIGFDPWFFYLLHLLWLLLAATFVLPGLYALRHA